MSLWSVHFLPRAREDIRQAIDFYCSWRSDGEKHFWNALVIIVAVLDIRRNPTWIKTNLRGRKRK